MGFHTFDAAQASKLEDEARRFRFCSAEELIGALDLDDDAVVADLGSGTGFYTDVVAPYAETVYAVDVQEQMHDHYREKGVPENVEQVTAGIADLPFAEDELDAAFSNMTYHEFAEPDALAELGRVLASDAPLVIVDWSAAGPGESGPPTDERFDSEDAAEQLADHGFTIQRADERVDTFLVRAVRD